MKIIVESAKDSGRSFGEPKVTVYEAVVLVDGATQIVDCFTNRVLDFIGKEAPNATITPNKNPQYHPKLNIPKEGQAGDYKPFFGGKKPFTPSFKDGRDGVILQSKSMLISYCKDGAGKLMEAQVLKPADFWQEIETGFKKLLPLLDLDSLPKTPVAVLQESTGGSTGIPAYTLKPALLTILKQKFHGWQNTTIVKYAGTEGVVVPHDSVSGDVFFEKLSEVDAQTLINSLSKE